MDEMVYQTQRWLNRTYGDDHRFNCIEENGQTGWPTIYALTRALQIELGIQNTADNFGPTSRELYGRNPLMRNDGVENNKYGILQGALWCKGYDTGHYYSEGIPNGFSLVFDEEVEDAVKQLKRDAGLINPDGVVTTNIMAALLSMDAFKLLSSYGGDANIRSFQQEMNRKYEAYIGIMPCDGVYGRNTNKALIYALQAEEDLPVSVANGNFGPTTKQCCPTIPYSGNEKNYYNSTYTSAKITEFTKLFKFGLYVNGFGNGIFDGSIDSEVVRQFQRHHALNETGIADIQTWMSTMISCGDNSRIGTACDTRFEITTERLANLKENGYRYIGRYLTGGDFKEIRDGELHRIFEGGLKVFPIFQTSGTSASYFSDAQGAVDAHLAEIAARCHGIPRNTIIYFAVDFDAMAAHITNYILPHFRAIANNISGYRVGIYGARNVCRRVAAAGYSVSSFVSDMSTGFSGNLGFALPNDWAFDQISNIYISHNGNTLEIDNNIFSGRDSGFGTLASYADGDEGYVQAPSVSSFGFQGSVLINRSSTDIPVYEKLVESQAHAGGVTAGGNTIGYINPNDTYTRSQHIDSGYVTSFGVTIHDSEKGLKQGYIETILTYTDPEYPWVQYQEPFHLYNSNGSSLIASENTEIIKGALYRIFTTKKELDRRNSSGVPLERLPAGTRLAVNYSIAGRSWPNYMCFDYYYQGFWRGVGNHYVDDNGNDVDEGGFVDLGLQHGARANNRAIW